MILTTAKQIRETLKGNMLVYRKTVHPVRVVSVRTRKGQDFIKLMHNDGSIEWVRHYPGDTYSQF